MTEQTETITNEEMETEKRKRSPSKKFYAFNGASVFTGLGINDVADILSSDSEAKIYEQTQVGTYDLTAPTVNDKFKVKATVSYQA